MTRTVLLPVAVAVAGAGLTMLLAWQIGNDEAALMQASFDRQANTLAVAIQGELNQAVEVVSALGALYDASDVVTEEEFKTFTGQQLAGHPEIHALEWAPRVVLTDRAAFEQARVASDPGFMLSERAENGALVPVRDRAEYFPVDRVQPPRGNEVALGFDLGSESTRATALWKAVFTGSPASTAPLDLVQDGTDYAMLIFRPVLAGLSPPKESAPQHDAVEGVVVGVFDIQDLMTLALNGLKTGGLSIEIRDPRAPDTVLYEARDTLGEIESYPLVRPPTDWTTQIDLPHGTWEATFGATPTYVAANRAYQAFATLFGGFALSGLLGVALASLQGRADRNRAMADELGRANRILETEVQERAGAEKRLRELADDLEGRVQIRTQELATNNQALGDEVEHRKHAEEKLARMLDEQMALTHAYSRFVPQAFLDQLGRDSIMDVQLGDMVEADMAVLFADIRSFVTLSGGMEPAALFAFLNDYLGQVSPVIRHHGGFIDKFIGDAIMAIFPRGADDAVAAALDIGRELWSLNLDRRADGLETIRVGIAVHAGRLMLGTVGEPQRMDCTVVSDVVNVAARLEGLTKRYGTPLLLSGPAYDALKNPERFETRSLGTVHLRGLPRPLALREVLEPDWLPDSEFKLETRSKLHAALKARAAGNEDQALALLAEILQKTPQDRAAAELARSGPS